MNNPTVSHDNILLEQDYETVSRMKEVKILPEVESFMLTHDAKYAISEMYSRCSDGQLRRGNPRKALIYWCTVTVCKDLKIPFDSAYYMKTLNITQRNINSIAKEFNTIIAAKVTIEDDINALMEKYSIQLRCKDDIMAIYQKCRNTVIFSASKSETVAAALIYYFFKMNLEGFEEDNYFKMCAISKETVVNIYNDIVKTMSS